MVRIINVIHPSLVKTANFNIYTHRDSLYSTECLTRLDLLKDTIAEFAELLQTKSPSKEKDSCDLNSYILNSANSANFRNSAATERD